MTMTTISQTAPTGAHNQSHAGIWHHTTHALGKLWAKVIELPEAPSAAARRQAPPSEYFMFPPF
jgi:hypothetical protein